MPASQICERARDGLHLKHVGRASADRRSVSAVPKKYREIRAALTEAGWQVLRQSGSHEVWGKPRENDPDRRGGKGQRYGAGGHTV